MVALHGVSKRYGLRAPVLGAGEALRRRAA